MQATQIDRDHYMLELQEQLVLHLKSKGRNSQF